MERCSIPLDALPDHIVQLILVDSYDSFTHNLAQAFRTMGADVSVVASDAIDASEIQARHPDLVVLGPGPGRPEDAGCLVSAAKQIGWHTPLLGVCLGHQAIALAHGGAVIQHPVVHGHATPIHHDGTGLFDGVAPSAAMTRYHSLVVDPLAFPDCLRITARSSDGAIQGLCHRSLPIHGIQFHPESVLSGNNGLHILRNFVTLATDATKPRTPAHGLQIDDSIAMGSARL